MKKSGRWKKPHRSRQCNWTILRKYCPTKTSSPQEASAAPAYTQDMPVDKICSLMSLDEARNYTVKEGACSGWTLAQVEERRPASLKFYVKGYSGKDNILRAGATLLLSAAEAKAS